MLPSPACGRGVGGEGYRTTRLIFTSREALPEPFAADCNRIELHQLAQDDAVKLVERALNTTTGVQGLPCPNPQPPARQALHSNTDTTESIIQLVEAVHCHARTLALLAPSIRTLGVERTHADLVKLMAEMERCYPGNREQSVYASLELSLRRLSPKTQDKVKVLGVFQGGVDLDVLRTMMQWEQADVELLAEELIATGLATPNPYNHLSLNPSLCPYLRGQMDDAEREALTIHWVEEMLVHIRFLVQWRGQNAEIAATLTGFELSNLFALLDRVQQSGDPEETIDLTTSLYSLLQFLGKPRLLERVRRVRDAAAAKLGDCWNHAQFEAQRTRIEQQLGSGHLREAYEGATALLQRARSTGEHAYPSADYDLAMAYILLGVVLKTAGQSKLALPVLDEAQQRFEAIAKEQGAHKDEQMASVCLVERGDCLRSLGRLDEAAAAYEEVIRHAVKLNNDRQVAIGKFRLGTVRFDQRRYPEALAAYQDIRERFSNMDEPGSVAIAWHHTGLVYQKIGQPEMAEDAYRKSLEISVRLGEIAVEVKTLGQLGHLYGDSLGRIEDAITFLSQAADKYIEIGDTASEGSARSNLTICLRKLNRIAEARQEIHRAIECKKSLGHAGTIWNAWAILAEIETDDGNPTAAAEARAKALNCYLAYRRDGGENHNSDGRTALAVAQALRAGDNTAASELLQAHAANPGLPSNAHTFIHALQTIVAGSRDPQLAHAPDLDFSMAAEILLLLEKL